MEIYERQVSILRVPVPWLLGICVDCTVSISERDFATAQRELTRFLQTVHQRSYDLPGLPSDFVSLTAFKEKDKIFGPRPPLHLVKMDQASHVGALCNWVMSLSRDGSATALYDAVRVASSELVDVDRQLPHNYLKVVIAITDGEDNDSRTTLDELRYFATTSLSLAVIGVGDGSNAELKRLGRYAASVYRIDGFGDLFEAITVSIASVIDRRRRIRF